MNQEIKNFTTAINARKPEPDDKYYPIYKSLFRRANYFIHDQGFLIIKISRTDRPFWGVNKKYFQVLDIIEDNCFLVLLDSENSGYVFTAKEIKRKIKRKEWGLASDNNYKINSYSVSDRYLFKNIDEFLTKIGAKVL